MPKTLERIKGYTNAFDVLCKSGESKVIENALLLSAHLLPASQVFAFCYNGEIIISLDRGNINITSLQQENHFASFLFPQQDKIIFPLVDEAADTKSGKFFAAFPLTDKDGLVFGKIGWVDESKLLFNNAAIPVLQLAATQLADLVVTHAAEIKICNNLLNAVAQTGTLLLDNEEWQVLFQKSLAVIGNSFKVSRVYFLEVKGGVSLEQDTANIRFEWTKDGSVSQFDNAVFKNISLQNSHRLWKELEENKIFDVTRKGPEGGYLTELMTQLQSLSLLMLPLVIKDRLFGVIVLNETEYERIWTNEEKATLKIIGDNLIAGYETNRTQAEAKKVTELFGYVMKATNDLIWDWDILNNVIERSENGFKHVTGYDYHEVKQTIDFWPSRVHPDDKEIMLVHFNAALNNPAIFFWENNFRFLKKNGSYGYLEDRCYIIRDAAGKAIRAIGAAQDVTEQRIAVMRLANSEQRFRSMIYNISDVIMLVNKDTAISYQSASAKRILGFDDNEILGKSFFMLLHPDDAERVTNFFDEALVKPGDSPPIQFRYLTNKGTYLSLEAVGNNQLDNPAINALIVVSRDITERINAGDAIRASEEKFRSLVHNISDIISIISPAGQILYQSSSAKQRMGYAENELSNRSIGEIVHPEDFPLLMGAFGRLIQTGGTSDPMEFRIMNKDGTYFYIEAQATNQISNPNIQGIVITSRDISQRKKTEEERKLLIEELTKNNADLTQFSYIVSHDLRAPLTNLIAMIKLLDFSTIQNPRSLKLLKGFKTSTFKLRDTLNDLTDVLLVKNNINVEIKMLSLQEVFVSVLQSVSSLVERSGAVINVNFADAPVVKYSETYLESIFQNLLTNAIRYASPDRAPQINIVTKIRDNSILMTFADNGIGFNMNMVKGKIFGLHQRFHHHPESRGIGLYLIHSQITSLGGAITVDSEEGTGTTFFITLKNS